MTPEPLSTRTTLAERQSILDYPAIVWLHGHPNNSAYLCEEVELHESGWVLIQADGWLAPNDDGTNEMEYFDAVTAIAVPPQGVRFIEWKPDNV